jgi:DNA-binding IclR family transcriptional regulator
MDVIETAQARPSAAAHSCAGESVASKIMRLLDAFRDDGTGLGPSEVARRSGLPYATVHRLLTELVRVGALQHDDCGRYSIGLRLWEIGASTPVLIRLRTVALPHLQSLAAAGPSRAAHLDVLDNGRGLRLEQMSSRQAVLAAGDAATFPLHATSGGQVLLAHSATAVVDHLLAQPLLRFTPRTVTVPDHCESCWPASGEWASPSATVRTDPARWTSQRRCSARRSGCCLHRAGSASRHRPAAARRGGPVGRCCAHGEAAQWAASTDREGGVEGRRRRVEHQVSDELTRLGGADQTVHAGVLPLDRYRPV